MASGSHRRTLSSLQLLGIVVLTLLGVWYLHGVSLSAGFSIFDDHEIMWFAGTAARPRLEDLPQLLMQTEVGPGAELPRFRPAYYSLRILETWAWGKNPAAWYAAHLAILAFFIMAVWRLASSRIGFLAAGFVSLYVLGLPFWNGIFSTIGPGEAYATLGLALYLLGLNEVLTSRRSWGWLLLLAGTIVASGSKENFTLLALPLPVLLGWEVKRRGWNVPAALATGLAVAWSAWIGLTVMSRVAQRNVDIYGNPTTAGARLRLLAGAALDLHTLAAVAALVIFALVYFWSRSKHPTLAGYSRTAAIWAAILAAIYASQYVFYNGELPSGMRNDLPAALVLPALLVLVLWYLRKLALTFDGNAPRLAAIGIPLAAAVVFALGTPNFAVVRQRARNNAVATAAWFKLVTELDDLARSHPDYPLVYQSNDPADFEPVTSYPRYLRASGATNPAYFSWIPKRSRVSNFFGSFSDQLSIMSEEGVPGLYLPLAQLDSADTRCILVVISGKPRWPCEIQVDADWHRFY